MKDINILDNFVDEREFRNYIISYLIRNDYYLVSIDDTRISDKTKKNDNDFIVFKDDTTFTVQTFLNKGITDKDIEETKKDMKKEKLNNAIIVTNKNVKKEMINKLKSESITVIDRKELESYNSKKGHISKKEIEIENKAVKYGTLSMFLLLTVYFCTDIIFNGRTDYGLYSIISLYCSVFYGYKGFELNKKHLIFISIVWFLCTQIFFFWQMVLIFS